MHEHASGVSSAGLRRDLALLDALATDEALATDGLGVVQVAEATGRARSQVSRALRAMEAEGVVERDPATARYRLGWRLFALVGRTAQNRLVRCAEPRMRGLATSLGETVHLCVLRDASVLTVLSVSVAHGFRAHGWEGVGVPAPRTSAGRVLLADADLAALRARLPDPLPPAPPGVRSAVVTVADLHAVVAAAREDGWAGVDEEFERGLAGVSAPVREARGRVVAALNVSAPRDRLATRLDDAGGRTARAAASLSADLGWRDVPVDGPA
jgi:IclR family transcriptional regulator, KDG regulon repressor